MKSPALRSTGCRASPSNFRFEVLISRYRRLEFSKGLFVQPQRPRSAAADERSEEGTRKRSLRVVRCIGWLGVFTYR